MTFYARPAAFIRPVPLMYTRPCFRSAVGLTFAFYVLIGTGLLFAFDRALDMPPSVFLDLGRFPRVACPMLGTPFRARFARLMNSATISEAPDVRTFGPMGFAAMLARTTFFDFTNAALDILARRTAMLLRVAPRAINLSDLTFAAVMRVAPRAFIVRIDDTRRADMAMRAPTNISQ
ncbi:hypothetical protein SAMN04488061_2561 [Filomicrobium insigne]|uniref:Uncharacterized protein n=2 Tax=Filomicrobium insigne TaxID=418854 RepID=A0A1H0QZQ6_9HYPH|nr:hypothetical protein SAMN04488061_2561 [Filomicrobium insigne]